MRAARATFALVALCACICRAESSSASACPGDCNVDAATVAGEVVRCVSIALGVSDRNSCLPCDQNDDGTVTIDELVDAVERTLSDCQSDFAEAAAGVSSSAMDSVDALQVLNFGSIGNFPAASGGGAGFIQCVRCSGGGEVTSYSCSSDNQRSVLTAVLDSCSDGTTTRHGQLELETDEPSFCSTCALSPGATGVQTLSEYREESSDGRAFAAPKSLREAFTITAGGCRGFGLPDRVSRFDGELRVTAPGKDSLFRFAGLTGTIASLRVTDELCTIATRLDGTFQVEDFVTERTFVQSSNGFQAVEATDSQGIRRVELGTVQGGFMNVDCLGGALQLATTEPLLFAPGETCASAGRLEYRFPSGAGSAVAAITNDMEQNGLAFDFDLDGTIDRRVDSCNDPSLAECRVPLQGIVLVTSDFALDADGWTTVGDATPAQFRAEGGNPGGHVCAEDLQQGIFWYWSAPLQFLGDMGTAYQGTLRFDLEQLILGPQLERVDVVLQGGGLLLDFTLSNNPRDEWTSYVVPLDEEAGWVNERTRQQATQAHMLAALGSLDALFIRGEFSDGADQSCLDNVVLSAAP